MSTNQTIKSHKTTREYVRRCEEMGGAIGREGFERYCPGCGRLPAWCECEAGQEKAKGK